MATGIPLSSRAAALYQRLSEKLKLELISHEIEGEPFQLYKVENIDLLLDELIALDDDHIDIVDERLPYWADLWPAAIGLSRHLLRSPLIGPGVQVLEIGCGLGLCGIAAARSGASVTLTDYLPAALELAELNALKNLGEALRYELMDWRSPIERLRADVLLASDVAYENRAFQPLIHAFESLVRPGGTILLSEPRRVIARPFLQDLPSNGFRVERSELFVEFQHREVGIDIYQIRRSETASR
jgi:predicted nicotinamide N-methyase